LVAQLPGSFCLQYFSATLHSNLQLQLSVKSGSGTITKVPEQQ
jgi:hypothetical protein